MDYDEATAWLASLPRYPRTPSPERVRRHLGRLGDPHHKFLVVPIAGTNGKGSTAATLAAILRASGSRVGLFTSPHLERVTERLAVDGARMSASAFAAVASRVAEAVAADARDDPAAALPSTFDALTLMALTWFADAGVDVAVLEAGIGGRLDSTHVTDAPVVAVTNVDLEHTEVLGASRPVIAREKAALAHAGSVLVTAAQDEETLEALAAYAAANDVTLRPVRPERVATAFDGTTFDVTTGPFALAALRSPLIGRHQAANAACAVAVAGALHERGVVAVDDDAVRKGVAAVVWPARLEVVARDPVVIVDAAHNPHGATAAMAALDEVLGDAPRVVVTGGSIGKPFEVMVPAFVRGATHVVVTQAAYHGVPVAEVAAVVRRSGVPVATVHESPTVAAAVALARRLAQPGAVVLVLGGLFLAAEARSACGASERL